MEDKIEKSNKENAENKEADKIGDENKEKNQPTTEILPPENPINEIKNNTIPPQNSLNEKNNEKINIEKPSSGNENSNSILNNLITIQKLSKKNMSLKQLCKFYIL